MRLVATTKKKGRLTDDNGHLIKIWWENININIEQTKQHHSVHNAIFIYIMRVDRVIENTKSHTRNAQPSKLKITCSMIQWFFCVTTLYICVCCGCVCIVCGWFSTLLLVLMVIFSFPFIFLAPKNNERIRNEFEWNENKKKTLIT